jgi:aminoglycoside phosphotransferase family enzyme
MIPPDATMPEGTRCAMDRSDERPDKADRQAPGLEDKVAFLGAAATWPAETSTVDRIETHAAMIFLTADRAWKLKKPVRLPWLDLRSLDARERNCREELRINRELAGPEIYLDVVALVQQASGDLAVGGEGRVVDWLLEMRRLPESEMLEQRLEDPRPLSREAVAAACDTMIAFYKAHRPAASAGEVIAARMRENAETNEANLREMQDSLDGDLPEAVLTETRELIARHAEEIRARGRGGHLAEGHGDLRPEHVCLQSPPVIFDRVEFDSRLRLVDPFDELGYLGLECRRLGAAWIADLVSQRLDAAGMTPPSEGLRRAYGLHRCLTRARLTLDHLRDRPVRTPGKWPRKARSYLALAESI